jgi:hypothetical protein
MNELIKEFAKQANIEFTYDPTEVPTRAFVECWEEDLEKFVHLIIQECMNMCDAEKADYTKYRKNAWDREEKEIYAEGEAACDTLKHRMKREFEVK